MQLKIFTDDEKEQRYSISVNLKSWLNADHKNIEKVIDYITIQIDYKLEKMYLKKMKKFISMDESSLKTLRHHAYHHRLSSSRPKCARAQPRNCKTLHVFAGLSINKLIGPVVSNI